MPAKRRASATTAICLPRRAAMWSAQLRSASVVGARRRRAEASDIVEGRDEGGGGDWADAGDGAWTIAVALRFLFWTATPW